jgi:dipeptidyl aminopeptidase/acylaminoacyl peptidase
VDGGEAQRISEYQPGVGAFRWMPDGRHPLFIPWVWPELRGAKAQNRRYSDWASRKATGLLTEQVQYRYWNANLAQDRLAHLHLLDAPTGRIIDLFEDTEYELPRDDPGLSCFDISPDGQRICFAHDPAPVKAGGQRWELLQLTLRKRRLAPLAHHSSWDFNGPRYSPDGLQIAAIATPVCRTNTAFAHASFGSLAMWPVSRAFKPSDARPSRAPVAPHHEARHQWAVLPQDHHLQESPDSGAALFQGALLRVQRTVSRVIFRPYSDSVGGDNTDLSLMQPPRRNWATRAGCSPSGVPGSFTQALPLRFAEAP